MSGLLESLLYFAVGCVLLIVGSNFLVSSSSTIARRFGISEKLIALTLVAFGTSLPEFISSVYSVIIGDVGLPVGTVIGSCAFNIGVIIGLVALVFAPSKLEEMNAADWSFLLATVLFPLVFYFMGEVPQVLFPFIFVLTFAYLLLGERKIGGGESVENLKLAVVKLLAAIFMIYFGAKFTVDGITKLSDVLGVSTTILGALLLASVSSFPELFTTVIAMHKGLKEMSIGNIVGSNIFNFYVIVGFCGAFKPLNFAGVNLWSYVVLLMLTLMFLVFVRTGRRLSRVEGLLLLLVYGLFVLTMF